MFKLIKQTASTITLVNTFADRSVALDAFDALTLDAVAGNYALRVHDADGNTIAEFRPNPGSPST